MTPRTKNIALIAGFALLAILAVAGWTRTPNTAAAMAPSNLTPAGVYTNAPAASVDPNRTTYGQPTGYQPAYVSSYDRNCVDPTYNNAAYAPADDSYPRYRTYNRPRVVRASYPSNTVVEREREVVVHKRGRSKGKSVAIVAGSAGAGAAIGALAGGGKGAAIGALSGGAAGFIYDRLTHNR